MDWIDEALEHAHGTEELRKVAEDFLRADRMTQETALGKLWDFTRNLEGEEKTKFTAMAVVLETAARIMAERQQD
jgi:hypothetical protein